MLKTFCTMLIFALSAINVGLAIFNSTNPYVGVVWGAAVFCFGCGLIYIHVGE